ncbi:DUF726-domain-containing protein [Biscogniauxia marginata]|nr:DUF726-domain-containing protein [Biscogniauxia marginata]
MAPLTNEPDALRVVLNPARRKAFYTLVSDITSYMRSELELNHPDSPHPLSSPSTEDPPPPYSEVAEAPPSAPRTHSGNSNSQQPSQENDRNNNEDNDTPPPRPPRPPKRVAPSPALISLRKSALLHCDSWRAETMGKLREVVSKPDDQKVIDARRKRAEALAARSREVPEEGEDLLSFDESAAGPSSLSSSSQGARAGAPSVVTFQRLYRPVPTRLASVALDDRQEILSATLILLLSIGNYSAYSRVLMCYLASSLQVPPRFLDREEAEVATTMVEAAQKADAENKKNGDVGLSADAETQKRKAEGKLGRYWKVGLASVAGAAIIGVTGGLAAPAVAGVIGGLMGSVGLGGLASFLGIFWMNGALVGTIFGAFGAKMTGGLVDQYAKEVDDFKFLPLRKEWGEGWSKDGPEARRLRVTIGINGWLRYEDDITKPWRVLGDETEVFALRYEIKSLVALGNKLRALVSSAAWSAVRAEILKRTVLITLQSALWPILLLNSASSIDNPFSLARNRSEKAGKILADALINKVQGERPVTLVGYSLGARVIYSCLRVLAERKAFGLIDTVVLIGAPVPSNPGHWQLMRTVVAGKLFNVYSENDYILGFLYRSTSLQLGIAGLQPIGGSIDGVENLDLSTEVKGHLRYPELIAQILTRCGFPRVKGGASAIEKEKEEGDDGIKLHDRDWAELGTLVDVDDPEKRPPLPSRHRPREMENEKFDPRVKNVSEPKSDAPVKEERLIGFQVSEERKAKEAAASASTAHASASVPNLPERPAGGAGAERSASTGQIPQGGPSSRHSGWGVDDVDDEDDEHSGGIKMMDHEEFSDAELTMVEPESIRD